MKTQTIRITEIDRQRLQLLLSAFPGDARSAKFTARLREELGRASVVQQRPEDVVGLDCTAEIVDLDSGEKDCFTLTLPERADIARGRLSVLTPLGTAILGYAAGDEFTWEMPGGLRRLRIAHVQPEALVA